MNVRPSLVFASVPVIAALLCSCASRETVDFNPQGQPAHTRLAVSFVHALPLIDVEVNGRTVPVVFDLGSNGTLWLSPEMAETCGAKFTGGTSSSSDAYGNRFVARDFVLDQVRLGDYVLTNVRGREFHSAQDGFEVKGILGLGALRPFRLLLDWPGNSLVLAATDLPAGYPTETWTSMSIDWTRYGIRAPVVVDGRALDMVWDSGASVSNLKPGRSSATLQHRNGVDYINAESVIVGGREVGPLVFAVRDIKEPPGDGIIGSNFFRKHRVLLDIQKGQLAFD